MEKGFVRKLPKMPTETQIATLRTKGLKANDIYDADKGEDVDSCLMSYRRDGGTLWIAADHRVFGDTQAKITDAVSKFEERRIRIVDLAHPELVTISKQQRYAFSRIAFMRRWDGDKRKAKRTGERGGRAKAVVAAAKRAERVPEDVIGRMLWTVENKQVLTWRLLEWVLGGKPFSTATLRRHYAASGPPPPPKSRKAEEE